LILTSINFQLNLGYALTFLIAGAGSASAFTAFRNLYGLKLSIQRIAPVFAGEELLFSIHVENSEPRARYALGVAIQKYRWKHQKNMWVWSDVLPNDRSIVTLAIPTIERGWKTLPRLTIETQFPMGIFRIWSEWLPATQALTYPALEKDPPLISTVKQQFIEEAKSGHVTVTQARGDEYDAIRPYRAGDPMKQIYWKKILPSGELLSRETTSTQSSDLWLSLESTGLPHLEAQLSRLTSWVLQAHEANLTYGLSLGTQRLLPAAGESHQLACLETLALFQKSIVRLDENSLHKKAS
ncbi:MAG: DUF58 domain-containing protein, partial [Saezia sp.]